MNGSQQKTGLKNLTSILSMLNQSGDFTLAMKCHSYLISKMLQKSRERRRLLFLPFINKLPCTTTNAATATLTDLRDDPYQNCYHWLKQQNVKSRMLMALVSVCSYGIFRKTSLCTYTRKKKLLTVPTLWYYKTPPSGGEAQTSAANERARHKKLKRLLLTSNRKAVKDDYVEVLPPQTLVVKADICAQLNLLCTESALVIQNQPHQSTRLACGDTIISMNGLSFDEVDSEILELARNHCVASENHGSSVNLNEDLVLTVVVRIVR
mmetsp:Transcript_11559/g.19644  ORF Transcript_11559/g.19644 Transcript_11559/m.19644 type:complete len:266 (+) Transcript_11559:170-967(+)